MDTILADLLVIIQDGIAGRLRGNIDPAELERANEEWKAANLDFERIGLEIRSGKRR
jgi:hypothetical protein